MDWVGAAGTAGSGCTARPEEGAGEREQLFDVDGDESRCAVDVSRPKRPFPDPRPFDGTPRAAFKALSPFPRSRSPVVGARAVLDVAGCAVCASAAPTSWRIHPFFPSHAVSGRFLLSAAAAGAPAGVVSAFAEPSGVRHAR